MSTNKEKSFKEIEERVAVNKLRIENGIMTEEEAAQDISVICLSHCEEAFNKYPNLVKLIQNVIKDKKLNVDPTVEELNFIILDIFRYDFEDLYDKIAKTVLQEVNSSADTDESWNDRQLQDEIGARVMGFESTDEMYKEIYNE